MAEHSSDGRAEDCRRSNKEIFRSVVRVRLLGFLFPSFDYYFFREANGKGKEKGITKKIDKTKQQQNR